MHDDEIAVILTTAERQLCSLIASRATNGDLSGVDSARTAALQIRSIMNSNAAAGRGPFNRSTARNSKTLKAAPKSKSRRRIRDATSKYPEFYISNGVLYRIGWSKKKKETYSHRVPRAIVFDIVKVMSAQSSPGPCSTDQLITRVNANSSASIPSYQIYAVIGFLLANELIQQVGRDGYVFPNGLTAKFESVWKSLDQN